MIDVTSLPRIAAGCLVVLLFVSAPSVNAYNDNCQENCDGAYCLQFEQDAMVVAEYSCEAGSPNSWTKLAVGQTRICCGSLAIKGQGSWSSGCAQKKVVWLEGHMGSLKTRTKCVNYGG